MTEAIRVLLVEDNPGDARLVQEGLASNDVVFEVTHVERLDEARRRLIEETPEAIVLDLNLPDSEGLETFEAITRVAPDVPVVVLTVLADEGTAVKAVANGAQDYLYKAELSGRAMPRIVRYAIERHNLRNQLAALSDDLQQLMRHAVHDLRTPVSTVAGVADVLTSSHPELADGELGDLMDILRRQSRRLGDLVADLLDIARLQRDVRLEPTEVADVCQEAVQAVPPPEHISVHVDVADGVLVPATASGLERIVTNLLANAYRYAGSHVAVTATPNDGRVEIVVADDGPGATVDFVPDLFDDFTRGPEAEEGTGTGLGLSIVRRLARTFGGDVTYAPSSELGGAAFRVALPRVEA